MRPFNQTYLDDILKFVNKYYQDNREAPTIVQVSMRRIMMNQREFRTITSL